MMPIKNRDSETEARMFFVAYTLDNVSNRNQRPMTFAFNGVPGSASVWLHLGALGPKRVKMNADGTMPAPPYELVDNEYTWLTQIVQLSAPKSVAIADTTAKKGAAAAGDSAANATLSPRERATARDRAKRARADSLFADAKTVRFKIIGHTVDIQALTRFMKSLEASPFIQNVQLKQSDLVQAEGKEVTEFTLEAETQPPPPFAIKTVPLVVSAVR
jgi:hypothetical protein